MNKIAIHHFKVSFALLPVAAMVLFATGAQSQTHSRHGKHPPKHRTTSVSAATEPSAKPAPLVIPDLEVVDENGKQRKFYTDLVKDKVVIVNFIFTSCKAVCPIAGANFAKLQRLFGERMGRDVHLISVTTDPETDSPEKLKAWAARFGAKPGWTLVTGKKEELTGLLGLLTGDGPIKGYHSPSLIIVNDQKRLHRFAYGLEAPERIFEMLGELNR